MDSDRSGFRAAKPVTRAMRGGMLLPYWTVIGQSSRSVLPRTLALLALSLGGAVLALALLGVLPESLSGPGTAVGVSAVLVAFAYGAMRSGTLLHGLVLLTPVVPLVAWAVSRLSLDADATQQGLGTIVVVLVLNVGLIVLGSLPSASGTVWATLDRLADRQGAPPLSRSAEGTDRRLRAAGRRAEGVIRALLALLPVVVLGAVFVSVAVWLSETASATASVTTSATTTTGARFRCSSGRSSPPPCCCSPRSSRRT